ncbi:MAG: DUF885 domain-containing protein [Pseudomonadales bacterium]|nr:DUF885 domain-containing protein [Pseudomonadales bacterium]
MRTSFALLALIAVLCGGPTVALGATVAADRSTRATPSTALAALFDRAWQRDLADDPLAASYFGDRRYEDRLPDLSAQAIARRNAADRQVLIELAAIDRGTLLPDEQLSYDLFRLEYAGRIDAQSYKPWLYQIRPSDGPQSLSETAELLPFQTAKDYDNWIARLRGIDSYLKQYEENLQLAIRERRTQPRVIMEKALAQLQKQLVDQPEASPFFAPFKRMPETIPESEHERLRSAGLAAIRERVLPAYQRFETFFRTRYLPATRTSVGIWDTPDGAAFYRNRVALHTTTQMTPDEIHEIGLREVARIRGEMRKVMAQVGWRGTLQEFFVHLRTDPKFYFKSPQDLFEAYAATAKRIDPELVRLFGVLPRMPYGVRPIPDTSAPNTTTAYYQGPALDGSRAGYFYVNLYRPEVRPRYEIEVLTSHEAVPGHHLQIALAQELKSLPQFRRNAGITAYVEGWGLYSESLGAELGLYQDPYSYFGYLTYDMWRAVRLVVDTGIHAKKWTRQQAIDYFKDNAAKTEADIVNEIDRYISWPGQALAYKIGQLRIRALRTEAEQTLGGKFDIRAFHDQLLGAGALPLDVLEQRMRQWLVKAQTQQ